MFISRHNTKTRISTAMVCASIFRERQPQEGSMVRSDNKTVDFLRRSHQRVEDTDNKWRATPGSRKLDEMHPNLEMREVVI